MDRQKELKNKFLNEFRNSSLWDSACLEAFQGDLHDLVDDLLLVEISCPCCKSLLSQPFCWKCQKTLLPFTSGSFNGAFYDDDTVKRLCSHVMTLAGRIEGCRESTEGRNHPLIDEVRMFEKEAKDLLDKLNRNKS